MGDRGISDDEALRSNYLSRRGTLTTIGLLGAAGIAGPTVRAQSGDGNGGDDERGSGGGPSASGDISTLENPKFATNAQGTGLPEGDDLVFDPGPASIPLDEILADDGEYDSVLFESLNDSRQLVVAPPAGYDPEDGYDDSWEPLRWEDVSETSGTATVGGVKPAADTGNGTGESGDVGTRVNISVEDAIPNGQYTVWVVKYAALKDPDEPDRQQFVTPAGNGLVGFHNLGQKFESDGESENDFRTDGEGTGDIHVFNEGGELSGVPGFRPLGDDPVEDGPVPFVGEAADYHQSKEELNRIDDDLREEDQIAFVGAYHYDDQTWGVYPGPWHLNQFAVSFVFG